MIDGKCFSVRLCFFMLLSFCFYFVLFFFSVFVLHTSLYIHFTNVTLSKVFLFVFHIIKYSLLMYVWKIYFSVNLKYEKKYFCYDPKCAFGSCAY